MVPPVSLWNLFGVFFRIACTSFGGFMTMIAVTQNAVVERRKLMSHRDILNGVSLASLLPGPIAINVCAYVGWRLRGGWGAVVACAGAILPAFALMVTFAALYFAWGELPLVNQIFMGFVPAVSAVVVAVAWNMSRDSVTNVFEGMLAASAAGILLGIGGFVSAIAIIIIAAAVGWLLFRGKTNAGSARPKRSPRSVESGVTGNLLVWMLPLIGIALFLAFAPTILGKLFMVFGGMSLMMFGGGYVFIPLIQEIVVDGHGWVTHREFVDGVALSQVMPGPILVSAGFIGYKVFGFAGAVVATVGIFTPTAVLMVWGARVLEQIKRSRPIAAALRGVRSAVIGMIFAAAVVIGQMAAPVWVSVVIFAAALLALLRWRVDVIWIIPPAGIAGLLLY